MKIYRRSDKIKVTVGDVVFHISPLTFEQRTEIQSEVLKAERDSNPLGLLSAARLSMRYAVKEQKGITYYDDSDFELKFDDSGNLTDECLDELLSADSDDKLKMICMTMAKGIPTIPVDEDGQPIKGIVIESVGKSNEKK